LGFRDAKGEAGDNGDGRKALEGHRVVDGLHLRAEESKPAVSVLFVHSLVVKEFLGVAEVF